MGETWFFHIDLDAFYASVEQYDNPSLKGKPVIVGGATSNRGVVSACSYEARTYGVHSALPIFKARELCPHGIYLPGRMKRYQRVSEHIMSIFSEFSPTMQQISIDEAFLDMSGTECLWGPVEQTAIRLQDAVKQESGLTASIGIASNKYIAKMASDRNKPNGICFVPQGEEYLFISEQPLNKIWGIGKKGIENLNRHHIHTVENLRSFTLPYLKRVFGDSTGSFYFQAVRGQDPGFFSTTAKSRSVSNEITLEADTVDKEQLRGLIHQLAHHVMFRLLKEGLIATTVGIKYRLSNFSTFSAQYTPNKPIYSAEEIFAYVWELFIERWDGASAIRLIGVSINSVQKRDQPMQEELFYDDYKRKHTVEKTVLKLRSKGNKIMKASDLLNTDHSLQRKKD